MRWPHSQAYGSLSGTQLSSIVFASQIVIVWVKSVRDYFCHTARTRILCLRIRKKDDIIWGVFVSFVSRAKAVDRTTQCYAIIVPIFIFCFFLLLSFYPIQAHA